MSTQPVIEYAGYLAILALTAKIGICLASWIFKRFLASSLDVTQCGGKWALGMNSHKK